MKIGVFDKLSAEWVIGDESGCAIWRVQQKLRYVLSLWSPQSAEFAGRKVFWSVVCDAPKAKERIQTSHWIRAESIFVWVCNRAEILGVHALRVITGSIGV